MVWWQWLGIAWIGLGVLTVAAIELSARSSDSEGPLSQDRLLSSIGYSAALIAGAPAVVLFSLGVCAQMLSRGRIPLSNRVWWPARAAKFAATDPLQPSRETTLCRMIELRRRSDPRLSRRKRPSNWPMFQLWDTTEAIILNTTEQYLWLRDGGLMEQIALEKIEVFRTGSIDCDLEQTSTLASYIAHRLRIEDPQYLDLGDRILGGAITIAEEWARAEIQRIKSERPFPPNEWLKARVGVHEIESGGSLPFGDGGLIVTTLDGHTEQPGITVPKGKDWKRMKLRMLPNDELWTFSSPGKYWHGLAGRMGVALIRNGRSIDHVITMMN